MSAPPEINLGLQQNIISEDELTNVFAQRNGEFEVFLVRTVQRIIGPAMEHLVRKIVKEQFEIVQEKLMTSIKCNFGNQVSSSKSRNLQLKFLDKISLPVFTGRKIIGEGCTCIRVALVDELTGEVVKSGPEATANFEIVVLEGYSGGNGGDNQNVEEFNNKIVRERKGKKTILKGITCLNLKEGISYIDELSFTHNSGWMKSCELCLGVRAVDKFPGTTIKEAKTESFTLKDCRTTLYGKRYPPSLCDEVWRLKNINKKGAIRERLSGENIYTVKDFLKLLVTNPQRLRKILRVGAKTWEVITDHARTCMIDERLYYYPSLLQKTVVVFNVVGQVKGLLGESQYFPTDLLSEKEKKDANKSVIRAFEHWEEVIPFDDETTLVEGSSYSSESPRTESPNGGNNGDPPLINAYDHTQPGNSSHGIISSINCIGESSWFDAFSSLGDDKLMDELLSVPEQGSDCPIYHLDSILDGFDELEHLLYNNSNHQPESLKLDLLAERRWTMVFFVLKWFRIRRRRRIGAPEQDHVQKKQRVS